MNKNKKNYIVKKNIKKKKYKKISDEQKKSIRDR